MPLLEGRRDRASIFELDLIGELQAVFSATHSAVGLMRKPRNGKGTLLQIGE